MALQHAVIDLLFDFGPDKVITQTAVLYIESTPPGRADCFKKAWEENPLSIPLTDDTDCVYRPEFSISSKSRARSFLKVVKSSHPQMKHWSRDQSTDEALVS
jgi:hypothetical protein